MLYSQGHAHRCRHSDRGGPANDHGLDGVGDVAIIGVGVIEHFTGQLELVEDNHAFGGPLDGFNGTQRGSLHSDIFWHATDTNGASSVRTEVVNLHSNRNSEPKFRMGLRRRTRRPPHAGGMWRSPCDAIRKATAMNEL